MAQPIRPPPALLRPSNSADVSAIAAIYRHHVRHGVASFETEPPTVEEMARRRASLTEQGYPYLVAEQDQAVIGYAYASAYRTRAAYRDTVEDSVYLRPDAIGRGVWIIAAGGPDRGLRGRRLPADGCNCRRQRERAVDTTARTAWLPPRRHAPLSREQARALARYGAVAAGARRRRQPAAAASRRLRRFHRAPPIRSIKSADLRAYRRDRRSSVD